MGRASLDMNESRVLALSRSRFAIDPLYCALQRRWGRPLLAALAILTSAALHGCSSGRDAHSSSFLAARASLPQRPINERCFGSIEPPRRLTEHPCFDGDVARPAEALVSYGVRAPLWSDGADKARFMAIPDGASFSVSDRGEWQLPRDGVLVKEFALNGRRLETRFLTRQPDGAYRFYTYAFVDGQDDAELTLDGATIDLGGETWTVPSERDCQRCHTRAAGVALGLQSAQLDRSWHYGSSLEDADQLEALFAIGFVEDRQRPTFSLADYVDDSATPAERARAYLHANCSHCHRPGGVAIGTLDLRADVSFKSMDVCMTLPGFGDPTGKDGRILVPGEPDRSILYLRLRSIAPNFAMPPLGRSVVDPMTEELFRSWIAGIASCST